MTEPTIEMIEAEIAGHKVAIKGLRKIQVRLRNRAYKARPEIKAKAAEWRKTSDGYRDYQREYQRRYHNDPVLREARLLARKLRENGISKEVVKQEIERFYGERSQ